MLLRSFHCTTPQFAEGKAKYLPELWKQKRQRNITLFTGSKDTSASQTCPLQVSIGEQSAIWRMGCTQRNYWAQHVRPTLLLCTRHTYAGLKTFVQTSPISFSPLHLHPTQSSGLSPHHSFLAKPNSVWSLTNDQLFPQTGLQQKLL